MNDEILLALENKINRNLIWKRAQAAIYDNLYFCLYRDAQAQPFSNGQLVVKYDSVKTLTEKLSEDIYKAIYSKRKMDALEKIRGVK